jgi:peroxiredoxin
LWIIVAAIAVPAVAAAQKAPAPPSTPSSEPYARSSTVRERASIVGAVYVGATAHDFELDGSRGKPVQLSRLRGDWVLLAFADRKEDLEDLAGIGTRISKMGARLVGICHEKPGAVRNFADQVPFLVLADLTGEVSDVYGLYDHEHTQTVPGYLILDRRGVVRSAILGVTLPPDQVASLLQYAMTGL